MARRDTERTRRGYGEDGRSAPGGASLPRFPFGVLFLMVFFFIPIRPIIFFPPVTMISTDCSSCSALSVSLPNVVQRQPLSVAIQAHYSVKIAGPENEVSGWMSSSVRNQSKEIGGAIRPWSLSAWRRFAPTVPVFGDLGKRLNPRYLPVLENTCPQPTSVKERLSPRMRSPWSKT